MTRKKVFPLTQSTSRKSMKESEILPKRGERNNKAKRSKKEKAKREQLEDFSSEDFSLEPFGGFPFTRVERK